MKLRSLSIALLGLTLMPVLNPALAADSDPAISFIMGKTVLEGAEGPEYERPFVYAGKERISFQIPQGSRVAGDATALTMDIARPTLDARMQIRQSAFDPANEFTEAIEAYHKRAEEGLPLGAADVEFVGSKRDLFPYNGWKSLGFTWNYSFYGRPMTRTVGYLNFDGNLQLEVSTVAARADASDVAGIAGRFLASWFVISP